MLFIPAMVISALTAGAAPGGMVLDFSAKWCGPCQEMSPLVSSLERRGFPIRKVDVDCEPQLAAKYHITNIPAFVLIIDGREVTRIIGKTTENELRRLMDQIPRVVAPPQRETILVANTRVSLGESQEPQAKAAPPAEPARGLFQRFTRAAEEPAKPAARPALVRAKLGDAPPPAGTTAAGDPVAVSTRIRVRDAQGENFGSGTVVFSQAGRTIVLTCGHIFRNFGQSSSIEVDLFSRGQIETFVGQLIGFEVDADVGLIAIPTAEPIRTCRVAPPTLKITRGMQVVSVGCGGGDEPTARRIQITALNRYLGPDNLECSDVPVQGRSGGGLFTANGEFVIGVCTAADPRDQRGLYAGLKAVHDILDRYRLSHLYRGGSATDRQLFAATSNPAAPPPAQVADRDPVQPATLAVNPPHAMPAAAPIAARGERVQRTLPEARETDDSAPAAASTAARATPVVRVVGGEQELEEALGGFGDAEVVCVIRPRNQPQSASRVVVVNRASPRFAALLTEELKGQADVETTTLLEASARTERQPASTQCAVGDGPSKTTGPRRYRRTRSAGEQGIVSK